MSAVDREIDREARVAGIHGRRAPSLESIDRRRRQVWSVLVVVLCGVAMVAVVGSVGHEVDATRWVSPGSLRFAILAIVVAVSLYTIDQERHLRRLQGLLLEERVRSAALERRLEEHAALLAATRAVNSVLALDEVLEVILASALELLVGATGSVMLVDGADSLRVAAARGNALARDARVKLGESIAGRVARTREPLLLTGEVDDRQYPGHQRRERPVRSAMCVPLLHRNELLGVLNVNAGEARDFDEYDLRLLSPFAEAAATAIANARLFTAEQAHVAELVELDRLKSEFVASVSHELRSPLTSIRGAVGAVRRTDDVVAHDKLLTIIDRQARRLSDMVEEMLESARLERPGVLPLLRPVDVAALVRLVALDAQLAGRPVSVEAPATCEARGDAEALRKIVGNLIENAHHHGAEPVEVLVARRGEQVTITVRDHGPGVPPADRERIFDRFHRLDSSRDRPGVGLGLHIVRGLAAACGGTVQVDDAPGGGAAFTVTLATRAETTDPGSRSRAPEATVRAP